MKIFQMTARILIILKLVLATVTLGLATPGFAAQLKLKPVRVLSFPEWKDREILAADNRVARLNNEVVLLRRQPGDQPEMIQHLGEQLRNAVADASVVHNLTEDDYISVYLRQFAPTPSALQKIAKSLSRDEVADLLTLYLNSKNGT